MSTGTRFALAAFFFFLAAIALHAQENTIVAWEFEMDGDTEGWQALHSLAPCEVAAGALQTRITGPDPYMAGPGGLNIPADSSVVILIRMKISGNQRNAEFFWTTRERPDFEAGLEFAFALIPDGQYHTYEVRVGRSDKWRGTVTRLRLDPGEGISADQDPVPVEIDYIRVVRRGPRPEVLAFSPVRAWVSQGDTFPLRLRVKNTGVQVLPSASVSLSLPAIVSTDTPLTREISNLMPDSSVVIDWPLQAVAVGQGKARIVLEAPGLARIDTTCDITVHPRFAELPPEMPDGSQVLELPDGSWLAESPQLRLAARRSSDGFPVLQLFVSERDGWSAAGAMASPELEIGLSGGEIFRAPWFPAQASRVVGGEVDTLLLSYRNTDPDGRRWQLDMRFAVNGRELYADYLLTAIDGGEVFRFLGPALKWGEGAFGDEKDAAIFPGLEWLVDGEESSSERDVYAPKNLRYTPHPYRVTVPLMSVTTGQWTAVYEWDPLQEWAPGLSAPNPLFASPNTLENQANHMMGLFVPTVPRWLDEYDTGSRRPFRLAPGEGIRVRATVRFLRDSDPLAGIRGWLERYGIPEPPSPPRTDEEAIRLDLNCFMLLLWEPSAEGWHLVLDDPWGPRFDGRIAVDAWLSTLWARGTPVGDGTRKTLATVAGKLVRRDKAGALGWNFGFRAGFLDEAWEAALNQAEEIALQQEENGGWPYVNDEALRNMSGTTLGTSAWRAYLVLRAARIAGSEFLRTRGLRALEFMKRFRVPRGAQTWEVPLHAPDVLAAAYAIWDYLEGYQLTGNPEYLDYACYWAESSLPFLYLWAAPDRPAMLYGSIPVFGATWYNGAWFGRVVQWNGLELAYGLSKLAEATRDSSWQRVARGLVNFALQIQWDPNSRYPEHAGMYPDAFDMTTGDEAYHWDLSPEMIQRNLLRFHGVDPDVSTVVLEIGERRIHVSAAWPLRVRRTGDDLEVVVEPVFADSGFVTVAGLAPPKNVFVGAQEIPQAADTDSVRSGWSYLPDGVILVKLFAEPPTTTIRLRPVAPLPSTAGPRWNFDVPDYFEGWRPNRYIKDAEVIGGAFRGRSTFIDPYLTGPLGEWRASDYDTFLVRMSVSRGSRAQVFWARQDAPHFSETKSVVFDLVPDGRLHEYRLPLGGHTEWNGTILRLRIDPTDAADAEFEIDELALEGTGTAVSGEFRPDLPRQFALGAAYPNPFNPDTQLVCELPRDAELRVSVFDVLGREVVRLAKGRFAAGRYRFRWNGRSVDGVRLPSGIYVVRAWARVPGGRVWHQERKVVLLR